MKVTGEKRKQLYFEDVEENSEIPQLVKPMYTTSIMAAYGGVSGGFCPMHFDYGAARERFHLQAPAAFGAQVSQFMAQLMTDWIGPNSTLKKLSSYLKNTVSPGIQLTIKGVVVKKYTKNGENNVECKIWAEDQNGNVVNEGTATVILPSRT